MSKDEENARAQAIQGNLKLNKMPYNVMIVDAMDFRYVPSPTPANLESKTEKGK
jgi:hypothetical protein